MCWNGACSLVHREQLKAGNVGGVVYCYSGIGGAGGVVHTSEEIKKLYKLQKEYLNDPKIEISKVWFIIEIVKLQNNSSERADTCDEIIEELKKHL